MDSQTQTDLATALAEAIRSTQPKPKVTFGEFQRRKPKRPEMPGRIVHNGRVLEPESLTDEQIVLLGKLKPGKFLGDYVVVDVLEKAGKKAFTINYPCATVDIRMKNSTLFRDFTDLLQQITAAPAAKKA